MRKSLILLVLAVALLLPGSGIAQRPPAEFPSEQSAQAHCPRDAVVWLNLPTGIYHFRGERWYGRTKSGAFVCRREADRAGDRGTRNGQ